MLYIIAHSETIHSNVDGGGWDAAHDTDSAIVAALVEAIAAGATLPPVLVTTDGGNGRTILDGHHRIEAYRRAGVEDIPALVVDADDLEQLVTSQFDGDMPRRLSDLDDYILTEATSYCARTDHEWFAKIGG